jgi:hypothetical protein
MPARRRENKEMGQTTELSRYYRNHGNVPFLLLRRMLAAHIARKKAASRLTCRRTPKREGLFRTAVESTAVAGWDQQTAIGKTWICIFTA